MTVSFVIQEATEDKTERGTNFPSQAGNFKTRQITRRQIASKQLDKQAT